MNLVIYPILSTRSKRAMLRLNPKNGSGQYIPHGDHLERLAGKLGINKDQVLDQIARERKFLLNHLS